MNNQPLRVLIIDDSEDDALLIIREIKKSGYDPLYKRVETADDMKTSLQENQWDIILCDYKMPRFSAPAAITLLKETNIDIPIIIISGTIGEETAVECMRLGAHDYIMKANLSRLSPAVSRELKEAEIRNKKKYTEEALRHSEEKYRNILENIEDGYYEVDLAGNFTFFNKSMCLMLGYSEEEMVGMNNRQFTDKENAKKLFEVFNKVYRNGDPAKEFDWQIIRKDGTAKYIEASVSLLKDSSGKIRGFRGLVHDITERKLAEANLQKTLESLKKAVSTTIQVLVSALESRDPYTAGHQFRVAHLACAIAEEMGITKEKIDGIFLAGSIHDIGKISVPTEILAKPTKLTDLEFSLIKEHPQAGYEMLKHVESPWPLAQIIYQHHERLDGSGYPNKLTENEIIIEARIMAVADVVEAMASHRPYRPSLGIESALGEIRKNKGILFDSAAADACIRLFTEKNYKLP
jgi:PAS domain S-box-containing protein